MMAISPSDSVFDNLVMMITVLLFVPTISISLNLTMKHDIHTDQSALLSLKSNLLDPSEVLKSWTNTSSIPLCNWTGVTCSSRHQRVVLLNMSSIGLQGRIAPEIGNLSFLTDIDFSGNRFQGELPQEMMHLGRLRYIDLSYNLFSGEVPSWLGSLPNLADIRFSNNSFTGSIPISLFNASKLQYLAIAYNSLRGSIPQEIGNCGKLKFINLQGNQLTGSIPQSILNLTSLERFGATRNILSGSLPLNIFSELPKLQGIYLSFNKLSGQIQSRMDNCSQLQSVSLSLNNFSGPIPRVMRNLTMLETLYLGTNHFTGEIPQEIGNLLNLENLDFAYHALTEYGFEGRVSTSCDVYSFGILLMETFSRRKPTDEMFTEDWGLKEWVASLLKNSSTEFVDKNLITTLEESSKALVQCVTDIMELALTCTVESVNERIAIQSALAKPKKFKVYFAQR